MGFPIGRWVLHPLVAEQERRDSAFKVEIQSQLEDVKGEVKAQIAPVSLKLDTVIVAVGLMAKYTGTQNRIRREMREPHNFWGWHPPLVDGFQ